MPQYLITPLYTAIFAAILVATVPKKEIRRLAIYGIIFGAIINILSLLIGKITGKYGFINFGPLGIFGIPFFTPISWTLFFMLYFYFMPKKPLLYIYVASAILYSILFGNVITNLGIFKLSDRLLLPLITFTIWFSTATWGYHKLSSYVQENRQKQEKPRRFKLSPQPARKIETEKGKRKPINIRKIRY